MSDLNAVSLEGLTTEWLCVDVDGCKTVNIYKSSNLQLTITVIPVFQYLGLYYGDFNCWHTGWRYDSISRGGKCLANLAAQDNLVFLHHLKDAPSFFSGLWNTDTIPDLTLRVLVMTVSLWIDVFLRNSLTDNTDL